FTSYPLVTYLTLKLILKIFYYPIFKTLIKLDKRQFIFIKNKYDNSRRGKEITAMFIHRYKNHMIVITLLLIVIGLLMGGVGKTVFLITATITAGLSITLKAYQALMFEACSIELLVTIAVIGAVIIGEYVESAVVTFLFLFGDFLEGRTLAKTRSSLKDLTDMAPQEANVIRD